MQGVVGVLVVAVLSAVPLRAGAYDNDLQMYRLGNPEILPVVGEAIAADPLSQERFARFALDFAMATSPLPGSLIASVGDAAFSLSFSGDLAFRSVEQTLSDGSKSRVWPTEGTPSGVLFLPTLRLRKGLPFSLEVGGDVAYLTDSSMVATTGVVKWAIFEGFQWLPDVGLRAFVTTVLGTGPFNLVSGGWDIGGSYRLPLAGGAEAALYGGYQRVGVNASTNNIDFRPGNEDAAQPTNDDNVFKELPIGSVWNPTTSFSRLYFGAEVRFDVLVVGLDGASASGSNFTGGAASREFESSLFKLALRAGVTF